MRSRGPQPRTPPDPEAGAHNPLGPAGPATGTAGFPDDPRPGGPPPPKGDPEDFELRVPPRPVTRVNRRLLAVLAGAAALAAAGLLSVALAPSADRAGQVLPDVVIPNQPHVEAIARLPDTYAEVAFRPLPVADDGNASPAPDSDAAEAARRAEEKRVSEALQSDLFFPVRGSRPAGHAPPPDADPRASEAAAGAAGEPHRQVRMQEFLDAAPVTEVYNPHLLEDPLSPWQVMAGSILRAALITGLNSDLPGFVVAQLTEDVFDSVTGTVVLLPRGTRLLGRYDSQVAFGQERALVVWQRLILPNGESVVVENLPATDRAGYAGLTDTVDVHGWRIARGILLSSLLGVGTELAWENEGDVRRALRESLQDGTDQAAGALLKRELDVQPTLRVRPGWPLAVLVHRDLVLRPWRARTAP